MKEILVIGLSIIIEFAIVMLLLKSEIAILKQTSLLLLFFLVFYVAASVSHSPQGNERIWQMSYGIIIIPAFFVSLYRFLNKCRASSIKRGTIVNKESFLHEVILLIVSILSRVWLIDSPQMWDSSEYYYSIMNVCDSFSFRPRYILSSFRLFNHPSYGFSFWVSIGELLFPQKIYGVLSVVLILTAIASICLYRLFQNYWSIMRPSQAFLGSLIVLFIPLYWCGFCCIMPDYLMAIFFVFLIYHDYKEEHILATFWATMAAFCKEIGILLIASYYLVRVLNNFARGEGGIFQRLRAAIVKPNIIEGLCVGTLVLLYFVYSSNKVTWSHSIYYSKPVSWAGINKYAYNTFGIQMDNILTRLAELFVTNFQWILSCLFIISVYMYMRKSICTVNRDVLLELIAVLLVYTSFMCIYITAGSMRYNVIFIVFYAVVCYVLFVSSVSWIKSVLFSSVIILLMFVQSFYSIDFITNYLYNPICVGDSKMLCIHQKSHLYPGGDYYINNLQYRTIHKNFEKMLTSICYTDNDVIILAGSSFAETNHCIALSTLNGRHNDMIWDADFNRYSNGINKDDMHIQTLSSNQLWGLNEFPDTDSSNADVIQNISNYFDNHSGRYFVFYSPLFQGDGISEMLLQMCSVFTIGAERSVESSGNVLMFRELFPKKMDDWNLALIGRSVMTSLNNDNDYMIEEVQHISFANDQPEYVTDNDTVYVSIQCYEGERFINMGTSPKGVINRSLRVGAGQYLNDIDMALVGHRVGDIVRASCSVPPFYINNRTIQGKDLDLLIEIISKD